MTPCSVASHRLTQKDRRIRPRRAHGLSRWGWAGRTRTCARRPRPFQDGGRRHLPGSSSDRSGPLDMTCLRDKRQFAGAFVSSMVEFVKAARRFLFGTLALGVNTDNALTSLSCLGHKFSVSTQSVRKTAEEPVWAHGTWRRLYNTRGTAVTLLLFGLHWIQHLRQQRQQQQQ